MYCSMEKYREARRIAGINDRELFEELKPVLASSVGSDYASYIAENDEFFFAVKKDVEETSAWLDEGWYTDDDIRLAVGRAIMWKFGIDY